jgi:pimeloyl-ACP methyl ester carboxylesterase
MAGRNHRETIEGVELYWSEFGDGDAAPVVLLHGLNNSHLTWKRIAPALAADRRVLTPDLPGHGRSGRPDVSYELMWYARVIAAWLKTQKLEKIDIVGHSFGGGIAQMLLLECPERIRRVILVASGGLGQSVGLVLRLASLPRVVEHFGQPFMALGTRMALHGMGGALTKEDIAELSAFNSQRGSARAFARSVRDVIDWRGQRRTFFQRCHEISALPPIAVLWGDRDTLIPIRHGTQFAARVDGVVFKQFHGSGHYLHNEQPQAFVQAVREFLDDPNAPPVRPSVMAPPTVSASLRRIWARAFPTRMRKCVLGRGPKEPKATARRWRALRLPFDSR